MQTNTHTHTQKLFNETSEYIVMKHIAIFSPFWLHSVSQKKLTPRKLLNILKIICKQWFIILWKSVLSRIIWCHFAKRPMWWLNKTIGSWVLIQSLQIQITSLTKLIMPHISNIKEHLYVRARVCVCVCVCACVCVCVCVSLSLSLSLSFHTYAIPVSLYNIHPTFSNLLIHLFFFPSFFLLPHHLLSPSWML